MQKRDLVEHVRHEAGLTRKEAKSAVDAVLSGITQALTDGDSVVLTGFGSLSARHRAAYTARHPRTGEPVAVPARKHVVFKAGKLLNESVNV